ncbi:MAG: carboxyltransferase domain-containing protein, partial [bacterium]|nr:carboxyltransferase domain-containing protein [bacterium]
MSARRILPCGDLAFIVELDDLDDVIALHAALTADPQPGQTDVVAAAKTVLVKAVSPVAADRLARHVRDLEVTAAADRDSTLVEIDVLYDGEDLDDVAELLGLSRDGVIEAHTGQIWTAAFGGFAPGFTYCVGENDSLNVPRRETPRTAVPAKSVAIAGHFSAVYPKQSPGGWQLLGRTHTQMWDGNAEKPAYVAPGNRVQYRAVRELVEVAERAPEKPEETSHGLVVVRPGLQSLVQDLGRPGHADLGVPEAGSADRSSTRRANDLVGNDPEA